MLATAAGTLARRTTATAALAGGALEGKFGIYFNLIRIPWRKFAAKSLQSHEIKSNFFLMERETVDEPAAAASRSAHARDFAERDAPPTRLAGADSVRGLQFSYAIF